MFYESLIILNISTLNFSEGVPASVLEDENDLESAQTDLKGKKVISFLPV